MFEHLSDYNSIVVTGPQRSGTRICAKMIAFDTGKVFIDERSIGIDGLYKIHEAFRLGNTVIQAPALCKYAHHFPGAIVLMRRDLKDIISSQDRIGWTEKYEPIEKIRYDGVGTIAEQKYYHWDKFQRRALGDRAFEAEYENLQSHPLWVDPEKRKYFTSHQTG